MKLKMKAVSYKYVVPEYAVSAIVNGDYSGLTDEEETAVNNFIAGVVADNGVGCWGMDSDAEPYFIQYNDIDHYGSEVYDMTYTILVENCL